MTDLPDALPDLAEILERLERGEIAIPSRLGTTVTVTGEDPPLIGHVHPIEPTRTQGGALRASVVAFIVDAVAGLTIDTDPEAWAFTSDLSVRVPAAPAPARIDAVAELLRAGRRSMTAEVRLTDDAGAPFGHAVIGFARLERRPDDPEKPAFDLATAAEFWAHIPPIDRPLREAAGVVSLHPPHGAVELAVRDDLRNPAGALQGAMVALAVESAAEDLAGHHLGGPRVVTELDIRFLAQARLGPVTTRARFVGDPATDGAIVVELFDQGREGRIITTAYARTAPAP